MTYKNQEQSEVPRFKVPLTTPFLRRCGISCNETTSVDGERLHLIRGVYKNITLQTRDFGGESAYTIGPVKREIVVPNDTRPYFSTDYEGILTLRKEDKIIRLSLTANAQDLPAENGYNVTLIEDLTVDLSDFHIKGLEGKLEIKGAHLSPCDIAQEALLKVPDIDSLRQILSQRSCLINSPFSSIGDVNSKNPIEKNIIYGYVTDYLAGLFHDSQVRSDK